jgi:hypothetical protein
VEVADVVEDGWRHWIEWDEALLAHGHVPEGDVAEAKD